MNRDPSSVGVWPSMHYDTYWQLVMGEEDSFVKSNDWMEQINTYRDLSTSLARDKVRVAEDRR